jgi:ABC-2 type transport system ATP-binding protein
LTVLAVEVRGLEKSFGRTKAVDGLDLTVDRGAVYGVLGPNGAGKTTTLNILATLVRPDRGTARVMNHDVVNAAHTVRGLVSLTGQFASIDEDLTGRENLIMIARLLGVPRRPARLRADELLEGFELGDAAHRQVKHYSGGMRRRLDIAASIVVTPELLFLDEPTTGLDPRARRQVWDIVRVLAGQGTTILLCTQYLDEAEQLADRIAVFDHGRVIAEGTARQLKAKVGSAALRIQLVDVDQQPEAQRVLGGVLNAPVGLQDPVTLSVACDGAGPAAQALAQLELAGVRLADFSLTHPSLDDVFLALTGRPADADTHRREDPRAQEEP